MSRYAHTPPTGQSQISFGDGGSESRFPLKQQNGTQQWGEENGGFGDNMAVRNGSSNAYANGANQNCGNVLTDRSTTRVHAPPGGRSQIVFGDEYGNNSNAPQQPNSGRRGFHGGATSSSSLGDGQVFGADSRRGSNQYANGANQNCGNVLTDRSTTRLHAPPGGHSQISFGDQSGPDTRFADYDNRPGSRSDFSQRQEPSYRPQAQTRSQISFGAPEQQQQQQPPRPSRAEGGTLQRPPRDDRFAVPSNAYGAQQSASSLTSEDPEGMIFGANSRRGSNQYANGANQNCGNVLTDRSTTKIHAPPGGHSSFRIG